jgi:streptogramin lyase
MKRLALAVALAACSGRYHAPPAVQSIAMPTGDALKPFDAGKPGLARPAGMESYNGKVYVALANYDDGYTVRGPGLLGVLDPVSGSLSTIDLGGANHTQCLEPYWIRDSGGKLYVTCTGDAFGTGLGEAIVEVDPASGAVTRAVTVPVSPSGLALAPNRIWFADATSGNVYAIDRASFTVVAGPLPIACPTTGTYLTTNDVILVQGDLYATCSNSTGGILSRLDATTGAVKMQADSGPTATEFTETGDGRIAIVSGADNKLRLVAIGASALTVTEAYTYSSTTSTLQDIHARDQFLFTAASGSNTVQKLDLTRTGAQMLVGEANVGTGAAPYNVVPLDDDQALVANQSANSVVAVGADCTGGRLCWTRPQ